LDDTPHNRRHIQRVLNIESETASEMDSTAKAIMVGSAGSVWLNTQSQYRGIDDTPTEMSYQINNGLDDTLHDRNRRIIQRVSNRRRQEKVCSRNTRDDGWKKKYDHRTQFWCPHPHCQVHVCKDHRQAVHGFYDRNIILKGNSRESRVEFTRNNPGAKKATRTSGAHKKQKKNP